MWFNLWPAPSIRAGALVGVGVFILTVAHT